MTHQFLKEWVMTRDNKINELLIHYHESTEWRLLKPAYAQHKVANLVGPQCHVIRLHNDVNIEQEREI